MCGIAGILLTPARTYMHDVLLRDTDQLIVLE